MAEEHTSDHSVSRTSDVSQSIPERENDITGERAPRDAEGNQEDARTMLLREEEGGVGKPDPFANSAPSRVGSKGFKCLQPGALFKGIQRSGRKSYDVEIHILGVDFDASFLCGHLRIHGIADKHPDVTTYFDAQIIGTRFGFDTQDWGAGRQEDLVHWSRFPAFHEVQKDLIEPNLLLPDNTSRSALFMRWKERYVVPENGPQDLNGASFAGKPFVYGFYYIHIEFAPSRDHSDAPERLLARSRNDDELSGNVPEAKISGYYYHRNSEPYQQILAEYVGKRDTQAISGAS